MSSHVRRLLRAGLLTGIVDGAFSSFLVSVVYGSTITRLFQRVASALLGPPAFDGGTRTALIGLMMHFGVAFGWSAVFLLVYDRSAALRRIASTTAGMVSVAASYGPLIWMMMSLVVLPVFHQPPTLNARWLIQLIGHFPFVGLPIVWSIARDRAAPVRTAA